jgi:Spy/CpxP family protein refolding chaperone
MPLPSLRLPLALLAFLFAGTTTAAPAGSGLTAAERADLAAGRGMGQALAAEANGVPGPLHVLELADALELSPGQRQRPHTLFAPMRAEARPLGAAILDREQELDRRFAAGKIDEATLQALTGEIAGLRGELRAVHLQAHLRQQQILEPAQLERYLRLRQHADGHRAPAASHH